MAGGIAYAPNSKTVAVGFRPASTAGENVAVLWDVVVVLVRHTLASGGHAADTTAVAFTPDSRTLLTAGDNIVRAWDVRTGEAVAAVEGGRADVRALAVSPDDRHFATGHRDGSVRLWPAELLRGD